MIGVSQQKQPDYAKLVTLLPMLRRLVDAAGVVILEPDEAERVRMLGFQAKAGPWRVPVLPPHLVAGNPLLERLADDSDPFWSPLQSQSGPGQVPLDHVERSETVGGTELEAPGGLTECSEIMNPGALYKECGAILTAIDRAGGNVERRKVQKKLWRMGAEVFKAAVERLSTDGLIQVERNTLIRRSGGDS